MPRSVRISSTCSASDMIGTTRTGVRRRPTDPPERVARGRSVEIDRILRRPEVAVEQRGARLVWKDELAGVCSDGPNHLLESAHGHASILRPGHVGVGGRRPPAGLRLDRRRSLASGEAWIPSVTGRPVESAPPRDDGARAGGRRFGVVPEVDRVDRRRSIPRFPGSRRRAARERAGGTGSRRRLRPSEGVGARSRRG